MSISTILQKCIGTSLKLSSNQKIIASLNHLRHHTTDNKADDCSTKQLPKKKKSKTPKGKLDEEYDDQPFSYNEKEPLEKHPGGINPKTGEYGGPSGPEPTRYGDWERKGRVSDF